MSAPHLAARLPRWRAAVVAFTLIAAVGSGALGALGWPASGYRHTDFFFFWAWPRSLLEGTDPYDAAWYAAVAEREGSRARELAPEGDVSPYPLWSHLLFLPAALIPIGYAAAAWFVGQLYVTALALGALSRRLLRVAPVRDGLVVLGLTLSFQPLWAVVGGGNIGGFLLAATAGALAAALAGRGFLAGALLGLLVVKPQISLITAPALVLASPAELRPRILAGAALVAGGLVGASFVVRPLWPQAWLGGASLEAVRVGTNASVWTIGRPLGLGPDSPVPWLVALAVVALVLAWWAWRRPDVALATAAAVPLSLFLAPHARIYDQAVLLLTVVVIAERLARLAPAPRVVGIAVLAAVAVVGTWTLYAVALASGAAVGPGPDLREEWSALTPLLFLGGLLAADALAVRSPIPYGWGDTSPESG